MVVVVFADFRWITIFDGGGEGHYTIIIYYCAAMCRRRAKRGVVMMTRRGKDKTPRPKLNCNFINILNWNSESLQFIYYRCWIYNNVSSILLFTKTYSFTSRFLPYALTRTVRTTVVVHQFNVIRSTIKVQQMLSYSAQIVYFIIWKISALIILIIKH